MIDFAGRQSLCRRCRRRWPAAWPVRRASTTSSRRSTFSARAASAMSSRCSLFLPSFSFLFNSISLHGFHRVLLGFTGFYWVLPSLASFPWALLACDWVYFLSTEFLLNSLRFQWSEIGFTGFYLVLLGSNRFYCVATRYFAIEKVCRIFTRSYLVFTWFV